MKLDWIRPLLGRKAPFTTVTIDVTRAGDRADREVEERWRALRRTLQDAGAPDSLLDELDDALDRPVRRPGAGGRVIVATDEDGILVDRVVRRAPTTSTATRGPVPDLLHAAIYADENVDHVVALVDRTGADLVRQGWGAADVVWRATIEGSHDEIENVRAGGTSEGRVENRAADSWERNAEEVAGALDGLVARDAPEAIVISGDKRAVGLVEAAVGPRTRSLLIGVPGGSRGPGAKEAAFGAAVLSAVDACRAKRRDAVLDRFEELHGQGTRGVASLGDVVAVLRKGQVAELVLAEDPTALDVTLWCGDDPFHLAQTRAELEDLGAQSLREVPARVALLRSCIAQDAGLTFAPEGREPVEGVGAILRWHDVSTPRDGLSAVSRPVQPGAKLPV